MSIERLTMTIQSQKQNNKKTTKKRFEELIK